MLEILFKGFLFLSCAERERLRHPRQGGLEHLGVGLVLPQFCERLADQFVSFDIRVIKLNRLQRILIRKFKGLKDLVAPCAVGEVG